MKLENIRLIDDKYYLNEKQFFMVDKNKAKEQLQEIKFPAIVLDTEFFNESHNWKKIENQFKDDETLKDTVFVIQYSFASNLKEISKRTNQRAIKSLAIRRSKTVKYDIRKYEEQLIKSFINMCISKNIKTLVFAGKANDTIIITRWINKYKSLLVNKTSELFIHNPIDDTYTVNTFDIYNVMESSLKFSRNDENGEIDNTYENLKSGNENNETFIPPSIKYFINYLSPVYADELEYFKEENDIRFLCHHVMEFLLLDKTSEEQFQRSALLYREAKQHCYNDVLKTLYFLDFIYTFAYVQEKQNKYLKGNLNE